MNELVTEPTAPEPEANPEPLAPPPLPRRRLIPWLAVIGFVMLAGAVGFFWFRTPTPPELIEVNAVPPAPASTATPPEPIAVNAPVAALEARLARLEQKAAPPAGGPDLTPRIEALERKAPPDLSSLQARLAALEQRPPGETTSLAARIAVLEKSLGHGDRLASVQTAAMALSAGRPLGDMQGAPPALARFAHTKPPTEAALRLAFPAAEHAALDASRPANEGRPFMDRLLARAENLVTIRQGDRVVVGDPAAGVLLHARTALDAGDLNGAVAALGDLRGGAAAAMAGWLADAAALRDAKAALADMAAQP